MSPFDQQATVQVEQIKKSFGAVEAVVDVSFEVYPGEVFGLLGPNGAGKTTSIRMMLDIFRPDAGRVAVFGGSMDEAKKNRIGYMPEERGLYRDLRLEQTLVYLATLKGMSEPAAKGQVTEWLQRLDLYEHRTKRIQELSKGMQQKAQLIATLAHSPDLLVVDEPFSGLDPLNTRLVKQIIQEQADAGKTVVMSTHQMYQVEAMCNRIVLIDRGHSVLYGRVDEIKRRFAGHAVSVAGSGDFAHVPGVLEARPPGENGAWHLALQPGAEPHDLLRTLAGRPDITIDRFEVAEASLDDIFITVVQGQRGEAADA